MRGSSFRAGSKAPSVENAQKVIDDLHRKIGQLQVECDFLAGQPAISRLLEAGNDCAGSGAVHKPAMRAARDCAQQLLLPASAGICGGTRASEAARPDIHRYPVYGSRRLQVALLREGISVGRRRVRRLRKNSGYGRSGRNGTPASDVPRTRSTRTFSWRDGR